MAGCSVDPFSKKDWYEVKAPSMFSSRNVGKTLVTRTQGTKVRCSLCHGMFTVPCLRCTFDWGAERSCWWRTQIASDGLKGRVFDVSLADLQKVRWCLQ